MSNERRRPRTGKANHREHGEHGEEEETEENGANSEHDFSRESISQAESIFSPKPIA